MRSSLPALSGHCKPCADPVEIDVLYGLVQSRVGSECNSQKNRVAAAQRLWAPELAGLPSARDPVTRADDASVITWDSPLHVLSAFAGRMTLLDPPLNW